MSNKPYSVYYDYTGGGRGPEEIAGPFDTRELAEAYAEENEWSLTGDNYFVERSDINCG